jgi:hypothetical protein
MYKETFMHETLHNLLGYPISLHNYGHNLSFK